MIPLYTNLLKPEEYGILELLTLTIDVISTIVGVGMAAAVMRFYYKYDEVEQRKSIVSSSLISSLVIMAATTLVSLLLCNRLTLLVFSSSQYTGYLRLMIISMFFSAGIEIPLVYLRAKQKSVQFVVISTIRLLLSLTLNIVFLVILHKGVEGILYSGLISSILISTYLLVATLRDTGIRFNLGQVMDILKFGAPLLISDMSAFMLTFADRFFLNHYRNLESVGLYSLAYKFGMLISVIFIVPFHQIWSARMFEIARQEDAKEIISKILSYFLMGALFISLGLSVMTKDILRLISNPSYWSAYSLVPLISLAYVLNGIIYVVGVGILVSEKTKFIAIATAIAMTVNLLFNFLLIPEWGKIGAAYSTFISYFVRVALIYYFSQKLFRINYNWKQMLQIGGIYCGIIVLFFAIKIEPLIISLVFCTALTLSFPLLLYFLGIFNQKEKAFLRTIIRNPKQIKQILSGR